MVLGSSNWRLLDNISSLEFCSIKCGTLLCSRLCMFGVVVYMLHVKICSMNFSLESESGFYL